MRNTERHRIERPMDVEVDNHNSEYLRGYRDGARDRKAAVRPASVDGLLGALVAILLIAGVGYFGYNYATTGNLLPAGTELPNPAR